MERRETAGLEGNETTQWYVKCQLYITPSRQSLGVKGMRDGCLNGNPSNHF